MLSCTIWENLSTPDAGKRFLRCVKNLSIAKLKYNLGAMNLVATHPQARGIYNVGYGTSLSILELDEKIIELTNSRPKIQFEPERLGDVKHSRGSADKLRSLGWRPEYSLEQGLESMVKD